MTSDEFRAELEKAVEKAVERLGPKYEGAKVKSKEQYDELVARWGRRVVNTVLVLGTIAVSFATGYFFRGM